MHFRRLSFSRLLFPALPEQVFIQFGFHAVRDFPGNGALHRVRHGQRKVGEEIDILRQLGFGKQRLGIIAVMDGRLGLGSDPREGQCRRNPESAGSGGRGGL